MNEWRNALVRKAATRERHALNSVQLCDSSLQGKAQCELSLALTSATS